MGPGKMPKWNTKFSNSRICSPTVSQHTDFSKGITGYQPVSEGALQMRLALLPGEGVTGWHRHWVTEAYQASMHTLPINPLQWSGKSSYCNRVRGLPGDNVNSAATSRATSCLTLEHPLNRELMPSSSTPWQVGGTSRTSADQRPCHVSALLWPGLTRALLCDAVSPGAQKQPAGTAGSGECRQSCCASCWGAQGQTQADIKKVCAFKTQMFKTHHSAKARNDHSAKH